MAAFNGGRMIALFLGVLFALNCLSLRISRIVGRRLFSIWLILLTKGLRRQWRSISTNGMTLSLGRLSSVILLRRGKLKWLRWLGKMRGGFKLPKIT